MGADGKAIQIEGAAPAPQAAPQTRVSGSREAPVGTLVRAPLLLAAQMQKSLSPQRRKKR